MRMQFWRSIGLAGALLVAGWLLCPGQVEARRALDAASLNRQITQQQNSGNYSEAISLAQRLVALSKARYGQVSVEHADALERLAGSYFGQSKYAEAEPVYVQVVTIRTKVLGAHDERVLSTSVTLADLYRQSGRPQMGEPLLQKALAARIEAVGRNHASLADALRALADIELALERHSEVARPTTYVETETGDGLFHQCLNFSDSKVAPAPIHRRRKKVIQEIVTVGNTREHLPNATAIRPPVVFFRHSGFLLRHRGQALEAHQV